MQHLLSGFPPHCTMQGRKRSQWTQSHHLTAPQPGELTRQSFLAIFPTLPPVHRVPLCARASVSCLANRFCFFSTLTPIQPALRPHPPLQAHLGELSGQSILRFRIVDTHTARPALRPRPPLRARLGELSGKSILLALKFNTHSARPALRPRPLPRARRGE
jgi:hypothetical protein